MDLKPSPWNMDEVNRNLQNVRILRREGHFGAGHPEITEVEKDQVILTFQIVEDRKVVVQSVDITGNLSCPIGRSLASCRPALAASCPG